MTPLAALLVDVAGEPMSFGVSLNPLDEFRPSHAQQYRTILSACQCWGKRSRLEWEGAAIEDLSVRVHVGQPPGRSFFSHIGRAYPCTR